MAKKGITFNWSNNRTFKEYEMQFASNNNFTGNVTKNNEVIYSLKDEIGFFEHIYR